MPALHSLNFNSTSSDGRGLSGLATSKIQRLEAPDNCETLAISSTTVIDLHEDITLTSGFIALITSIEGNDIPGTGSTFTNILSQIYTGTGSNEALLVNCINVHGGATNVPTTAGNIGYIAIFKTEDLKHSATGF